MRKLKTVKLQSRKVKEYDVYIVTIPKEFIDVLRWSKGDTLVLELQDGKIVIYKP